MKHSALEWLNGRLTGFDPIWLVVFRHPSEKYESIGMMIETQYFWEKKIDGNQTNQPANLRHMKGTTTNQNLFLPATCWIILLCVFPLKNGQILST